MNSLRVLVIESGSLEYLYLVTYDISIYTPPLTSPEESILTFYKDLKTAITKASNVNKILFLSLPGSVKIMKDWKSTAWKMNNGLHFLQLYMELKPVICNSFLPWKRCPWCYLDSSNIKIGTHSLLCHKQDLQDVYTVRMSGAKCRMKHRLVPGKDSQTYWSFKVEVPFYLWGSPNSNNGIGSV